MKFSTDLATTKKENAKLISAGNSSIKTIKDESYQGFGSESSHFKFSYESIVVGGFEWGDGPRSF